MAICLHPEIYAGFERCIFMSAPRTMNAKVAARRNAYGCPSPQELTGPRTQTVGIDIYQLVGYSWAGSLRAHGKQASAIRTLTEGK